MVQGAHNAALEHVGPHASCFKLPGRHPETRRQAVHFGVLPASAKELDILTQRDLREAPDTFVELLSDHYALVAKRRDGGVKCGNPL